MKHKEKIEMYDKSAWDNIPWKKIYRNIRNLRRRIFRARREGDFKRLRNLQKLMIRSHSNLLESVRRVTQINQGKKTAGIDGQKVLSKEDRISFINAISKIRNVWKPLPTKRVMIPKNNGKKRPLGIPTITDRVLQSIHKNALEPEWEAIFEPVSYGFRPGRSTHDAMAKIFNNIKGKNPQKQWVVEGEIKGCFDNINHNELRNKLGGYPGSKLIHKWLNAGFVQENTFYETKSGTPQGSIISPLLSNIALHGIERTLGITYTWHKDKRRPNGGLWLNKGHRTFVRYADEFIVLCTTQEDAKKVKTEVKEILSNIGLELNEEKTRITHLKEGFNFLGWNFRRYKTYTRKEQEITLIKPSKDNIQSLKDRLREKFLELRGKNQEAVISKLSPILRGWSNYHKNVVSKEVFSEIDSYVFNKLKKWSKRLHPTKSWEWRKKYWGKHCPGRDNNWVFGKKVKFINEEAVYYLEKTDWTKIVRHITLMFDYSPDDPDIQEYWERRRQSNQAKSLSQRLSSGKCEIAKSTNYKCRWCNEDILSEGLLNTQIHHIVPKGYGGKDTLSNKIYLHSECHKQVTNKGEINEKTLKQLKVIIKFNPKTQKWSVKK